ncbi:OmpA family protein [uncultured Lutibacter sp.]|uniref:OmpA family protein n=1 Tax=uncultured Lutibacter sp. TaxID=437739 RepID=UPI0026138B32|nr:OmpA family protein [uncultured Lutibacter sp.]
MKYITLILLFLLTLSISAQKTDYQIINTSVNSKYAELGITYLSDSTVLFASSKKIEDDEIFKKDRRKNNRQLFLELYHGLISETGDITQATRFSSEINNKFFESDISFTPDFKTIYFTWNNFYDTQKRTDSAKWKPLYIFKASIDENFKLSNILPLTFNSKDYSVRSPEVSKDGKQLYFVSDMPNGYGNFDIYVSTINSNGSHGSPKNLGANVNTEFDELYPFVNKEKTLYFSSNGHKGKGSLDVFKSEFKDGDFQKAENLEAPINSKYDDFAFVINNDTNSGYFTSNRKKGKGNVDIYSFKPKEEEKCTKQITGFILDKETKKQIDSVLVSLYLNSVIKESKTIAKNTNYSFELKCNENYTITANKEKYDETINEIGILKARSKNINKNILLQPTVEFITVREQKMIKTNPIYFDLNSSNLSSIAIIELDKVVRIMEKNPTIIIKCGSHTDSRSSGEYNIKLSKNRAKSTVDYIISKGISSNRISSEGFGEMQLINKCTNNTKCSEAEHQMNRRTEFVIIDE